MKTLILHGWGGSDDPHWQAWLAGELAKEYGTIAFPLLDNPHFPSKNRWMRQIKTLLAELNPDVVICHSLACIVWFHLCHENAISPIKRLLLVAPPRLNCELETLKSFFPVSIPTTLLAEEALLVTSDTDPYMSAEEALTLQTGLNIDMKQLFGAGHINTDAGYGAWPWVKEWVNSPSSSHLTQGSIQKEKETLSKEFL
jgi:hypothetical protein